MAVLTFRRPEDGIDFYKQLLQVLQDITKNPNALKDFAKEIETTHQLSENKKQEARDAMEVIAQSKEFIEEFELEKLKHKNAVAGDLAEVKNQREALAAEVNNFRTEKLLTTNQIEKTKTDSEAKLAESKKLTEEARTRHAVVQDLHRQLDEKTLSHQEEAKSFERERDEIVEEVNAKLAAHQEDVKKLAEERAAFELRKKKFEAALKE